MTTQPEIRRDIMQGWDVLVIDDDPGSLQVAQVILTVHGACVHTAVNGEEGFNLAKAKRPRFIITDLSMPVMDGWTLIDKLQRELSTRDIPVIALTAHAMTGDRERALAVGAHNYLTKPLTPGTFMRDLVGVLIDLPELHLNNTDEKPAEIVQPNALRETIATPADAANTTNPVNPVNATVTTDNDKTNSNATSSVEAGDKNV